MRRRGSSSGSSTPTSWSSPACCWPRVGSVTATAARGPRRGSVIFGITSAYAGSVDRRALIVGRALMGIGAARSSPPRWPSSPMSSRPRERAKAIGIWSAVSGVGVAAGPITGGWLLEHFWWGSIFYVNVPIVLIAIVNVASSRNRRTDDASVWMSVGLVLSIAAITTLVFTIIEAPEWGGSTQTAPASPSQHYRCIRLLGAAPTRCCRSRSSATCASAPRASR